MGRFRQRVRRLRRSLPLGEHGLTRQRADAYFMDAMMMDGIRIQWLNLLVLACWLWFCFQSYVVEIYHIA
jgi:hypothetical protein